MFLVLSDLVKLPDKSLFRPSSSNGRPNGVIIVVVCGGPPPAGGYETANHMARPLR